MSLIAGPHNKPRLSFPILPTNQAKVIGKPVVPINKPLPMVKLTGPSIKPTVGTLPSLKPVAVTKPDGTPGSSPPIGTGFAPGSDVTIHRNKVSISHPSGPGSVLMEKTETTEIRGRP